MATSFAPDVPEQQTDNFINYSRTIQQPQGNIAGEVRGKAIGAALGEGGRLIGEGLNLGNQVQQDMIAKQAQNQFDPVAQSYITHLAQVDDVITGKSNLQVQPGVNAPGALKNVSGTVDDLVALRDSGKVSNTYFEMQKDQIAKNLRTQYPGQREFIDQEFARLTEQDPANKVIQSLTADINAYGAQMREQRNKMDTMFLEGVKRGDITPQDYLGNKNGLIPNERLLGQMYAKGKLRNDLEISNLSISNQLKNHELQNVKNSDLVDKHIAQSAAVASQGWTLGTDEFGSPQKLTDALSGIRNGTIPTPTDEQATAIRQKFGMDIAKWKTDTIADLTKPIPVDPNNPKAGTTTRATLMGGIAVAQKKIDDYAAAYLEPQVDSFAKGDVALGSLHKQLTEAHQDDTAYSLLAGPHKIAGLDALGVIAKQGGQQAGFVDRFIIPMATDEETDASVKAWKQASALAAAAQPNWSTTGTPFTLSTAVQKGQNAGVLQGQSGARAVMGTVNRISDAVTSKDTPFDIRQNTMASIAHSTNLMNFFDKEGLEVDPSRGTVRVIPGQSTVFDKVASPEVTRKFKEYGDSGLQSAYVNTVRKQFGTVFQSAIQDLNLTVRNPDTKFAWDSDDHSLHIIEEGTQGVPMNYDQFPSYSTVPMVQHSLDKINRALKNVDAVNSELAHEDTNAFLLQTLIDSGLDPRIINSSIHGKLLEALKAANGKS